MVSLGKMSNSIYTEYVNRICHAQIRRDVPLYKEVASLRYICTNGKSVWNALPVEIILHIELYLIERVWRCCHCNPCVKCIYSSNK